MKFYGYKPHLACRLVLPWVGRRYPKQHQNFLPGAAELVGGCLSCWLRNKLAAGVSCSKRVG